MNPIERTTSFDCRGETLLAILATPAGGSTCDTAVLIVVGGPQYRVGSHRQFTLLARALATAGFPVLRFDHRGMGDSGGASIAFEEAAADIAAAIDALFRLCPQIRRVVLWGLCDGASAALLYLDETADRRVGGVILLNPWVRSEASLARTHVKHYYLQRLGQREFWIKLLSGKVAHRALGELARNVGTAFGRTAEKRQANRPFQQRMAGALAAFDGPAALMLSGNDYTAKEFLEHANADGQWRSNVARANLTRVDFEAADHTFSGREAQRQLEAATLQWLARFTVRADARVPDATSRSAR